MKIATFEVLLASLLFLLSITSGCSPDTPALPEGGSDFIVRAKLPEPTRTCKLHFIGAEFVGTPPELTAGETVQFDLILEKTPSGQKLDLCTLALEQIRPGDVRINCGSAGARTTKAAGKTKASFNLTIIPTKIDPPLELVLSDSRSVACYRVPITLR